MRQNSMHSSTPAVTLTTKDHQHLVDIKTPPHIDGGLLTTSHHNGPTSNSMLGAAHQRGAQMGGMANPQSMNNPNHPSSSHFASGVSSPNDYTRGGGAHSPVAVANKLMGNNINANNNAKGGTKKGGKHQNVNSVSVNPVLTNQKLPKNNSSSFSSNPSPTPHNTCNTNTNDANLSPATLDLKLFDPDFVREKSSAGRISAKSSRGDLHLT